MSAELRLTVGDSIYFYDQGKVQGTVLEVFSSDLVIYQLEGTKKIGVVNIKRNKVHFLKKKKSAFPYLVLIKGGI